MSNTMDEETRLQTRLNEIRRQKEAEEGKKRLKTHRALIGQYFKFSNSYGSGDEWWEYVEVVGADEGSVHIRKFAKTSHDQIQIETEERSYYHSRSNWIKITPTEFKKARDSLLSEMGLKADDK